MASVPAATLAELADATHAVNKLGAYRSHYNSPAVVESPADSGILYLSKYLNEPWMRQGSKPGLNDSTWIIVPVIPVSGVATASVNTAGEVAGDDGDYPATTFSTVSGTGADATFTVTVVGGAVTAVVSVNAPGTGFAVGDIIRLDIPSLGVTNRPKLEVLTLV